jgi:hypothetical protein
MHPAATQEDKRDVRLALSIDHGLSMKTALFLEALGRWVLDKGLALTKKQRARLEEILEEHGR